MTRTHLLRIMDSAARTFAELVGVMLAYVIIVAASWWCMRVTMLPEIGTVPWQSVVIVGGFYSMIRLAMQSRAKRN